MGACSAPGYASTPCWLRGRRLRTDDFWRDHRAFSGRGVRFVRAPVEQPYGTVAVFEDLYGNRWDLIGPG